MPKKREKFETAKIILFPGPKRINFLSLNEITARSVPAPLNGHLGEFTSEPMTFTTLDCCGKVQRVYEFNSRCAVCGKRLFAIE